MAQGSLPGVGTIGDVTSQSSGGSNLRAPSVGGANDILTSVAGGGGPTGTNPQTPTSAGINPNAQNPNTPGGGDTPALQELVNMRISQSPSLKMNQQADAASRLMGAGLRNGYNPTGTGPSGSSNASVQQLLNDAKGWIGVPYEYGGTSRAGVDCSGFTQAVYSQMGMNIGRDTSAQFRSGNAVGQDGNWNATVNQLQPGDLIFYGQPGATGPNAHVVMYIGGGQVIQAAHTGTNVAIGPLFNSASSDEPFLGARRYLTSTQAPQPSAGPGGLVPFGNQQQFASDLLRALGDNPTAADINSIVNWENREGGNWHNTATYNPLNTTQQYDGSLVMGGGNSAGVQAYKNWLDGLNATVQTLRNGHYNDILSALARGGGLSGYIPGLGTWSGGGYYSV